MSLVTPTHHRRASLRQRLRGASTSSLYLDTATTTYSLLLLLGTVTSAARAPASRAARRRPNRRLALICELCTERRCVTVTPSLCARTILCHLGIGIILQIGSLLAGRRCGSSTSTSSSTTSSASSSTPSTLRAVYICCLYLVKLLLLLLRRLLWRDDCDCVAAIE